LVQRSLEESLPEVEVVNAGLSGDTTAGALRRVNWVLKTPADILVVALGGNDALRGLPPEETRANLMAIIKTARERVPGIRIVLAGMLAPPNMGEAYQAAFAQAYREVVEATKVEFMPFLLEGVAANPDLNLPDGIHPNAQGQAVIARNILEVLNL
jgi:acyl-CoA thioesterase-1